jgi:hypothetical protein
MLAGSDMGRALVSVGGTGYTHGAGLWAFS